MTQARRFTSNVLQICDFPLLCLPYTTTLYGRWKLLNPEAQVFRSALSFTARKNLEEHYTAINTATTPLYPPFGHWILSLFCFLFCNSFYFDFCSLLQDLQLDLRSMVQQVKKGFQAWRNIIALHRLLSLGRSNRFFPFVNFPLTHQRYLWVIPEYSSYLWTDNYYFKLTSKYCCSWGEYSYLINNGSHGKRNQIHSLMGHHGSSQVKFIARNISEWNYFTCTLRQWDRYRWQPIALCATQT